MTKQTRITAFAIQSSGSRNFGLDVRGLSVLVTATEGRHDEGRALAELIASLGPEQSAPAPSVPAARVAATVERGIFKLGQRVFCIVHGAEGYSTVTAVGAGRNHGRIKITGCRYWCPAGNFRADD